MLSQPLYPHPTRILVTSLSGCGKAYLLTKIITRILNNFDNVFLHSTSYDQDLYKKFSTFLDSDLPLNKICELHKKKNSITLMVLILKLPTTT